MLMVPALHIPEKLRKQTKNFNDTLCNSGKLYAGNNIRFSDPPCISQLSAAPFLDYPPLCISLDHSPLFPDFHERFLDALCIYNILSRKYKGNLSWCTFYSSIVHHCTNSHLRNSLKIEWRYTFLRCTDFSWKKIKTTQNINKYIDP